MTKCRLIDADKLEKRVTQGNPYFDEAIEFEMCHIIHTEDTVEAIPISWINEKIRSYKARDDSVCYFYAGLLQKVLLDEWKKENEMGTNK